MNICMFLNDAFDAAPTEVTLQRRNQPNYISTEDLVFTATHGKKQVQVTPVVFQDASGSFCDLQWKVITTHTGNYQSSDDSDHMLEILKDKRSNNPSDDGERILRDLAESYERLKDKEKLSTSDFRNSYWKKWDVARLQPALSWLVENKYLHKMECREICRRKHVRMYPNWNMIGVGK